MSARGRGTAQGANRMARTGAPLLGEVKDKLAQLRALPGKQGPSAPARWPLGQHWPPGQGHACGHGGPCVLVP